MSVEGSRSFRPRLTFRATETQTEYIRGLGYTIRPEDEVLLRLAEQWQALGLIEWTMGEKATVQGQGSVT